MKKTSLLIFISLLSLSGASFARQYPSSEIRESSDPAKASEVERHAAEIAQANQQTTSGESGSAGTQKSGAGSHEKKHGAKHGTGKKKAAGSTSGSSPGSGTSGGADQNPAPGSK